MNESQRRRRVWWFAGGVAAGVAGYLAYRYPVETAVKVGHGVLRALGARTHEIPWAGGTMRYVMLGRGPTPLVIVHGIGDSPESYGLLARGLLRDYRICIPILPGHPGSPAPPDLQLGHMVQAVDAAVLREFGGRKVHLYGNSLGGWVAALFAAAASERLESLMLVNPAGQHESLRYERIYPETDADARATVRGLFGPAARYMPNAWHRSFARGIRGRSDPAVAHMMDVSPRLVEPLKRITARTTVVIGETDKIVPPHESLSIADDIGHAAVDLIPGGSHLPHLTDVGTLRRLVLRHARDLPLLE